MFNVPNPDLITSKLKMETEIAKKPFESKTRSKNCRNYTIENFCFQNLALSVKITKSLCISQNMSSLTANFIYSIIFRRKG